MTANHAHTPTTEGIRRIYALKVPHDQRDQRNEEFWRWLAARDARIEAAAKVEAYKEAQQIVAGDMTIEEQRSRIGADKIDAAYLIRELDDEIQELQETEYE